MEVKHKQMKNKNKEEDLMLKMSKNIEQEAFRTDEMKEKILKLTIKTWMSEKSEREPQAGPWMSQNREEKCKKETKYLEEEKTEKNIEEQEGAELMNYLINNVLYGNTHRERLPAFQEFCP